MRKALLILLAVLATGCATGGYTGFGGMSVPGYEAAGVVAGNQMMIASIASQAGWGAFGGYYGPGAAVGFGNMPVCRASEVGGVPLVNQPVIVRVPKNKWHRVMDTIFGTGLGIGLAYFIWDPATLDWRVLTAAGAMGASVAGYVANHEADNYCLFLPLRKQ